MKNVIKIFILAFVIGLSGCTGFYVRDNMSYGYNHHYQNKYSIYNPYYPNYNTVTFIKPINYGYWNYPTNHYHTPKINHNYHYGHRTK